MEDNSLPADSYANCTMTSLSHFTQDRFLYISSQKYPRCLAHRHKSLFPASFPARISFAGVLVRTISKILKEVLLDNNAHGTPDVELSLAVRFDTCLDLMTFFLHIHGGVASAIF
jgi:hypothetical protein